jgi:guanylate kinase
MIRQGEFLEYAQVYCKEYYGTARRFLREAEKNGHDLLLDIDVQGAAQVKQRIPNAATIFVLPPDRKTLEWRLRNRGSDSPEERQRRLDTARREIENYDKYDSILVNDRLEESVDRLEAVVLSERARRSGRSLSPEDQARIAVAEQCRLANIRDRVQPILDSFRET